MPKGVVRGVRDEKAWERAKAKAREEYGDRDDDRFWAIVNHIYQEMRGGKPDDEAKKSQAHYSVRKLSNAYQATCRHCDWLHHGATAADVHAAAAEHLKDDHDIEPRETRREALLSKGEAEHAAFADHEKNPFHAVLTRHGFRHQSTTHGKNPFAKDNPRADFTAHVYTHPAHGKSYVRVEQEHDPSVGHGGIKSKGRSFRFVHEQANGIMAPTFGDTRPQLDRALTSHYGEPVRKSETPERRYGHGAQDPARPWRKAGADPSDPRVKEAKDRGYIVGPTFSHGAGGLTMNHPKGHSIRLYNDGQWFHDHDGETYYSGEEGELGAHLAMLKKSGPDDSVLRSPVHADAHKVLVASGWRQSGSRVPGRTVSGHETPGAKKTSYQHPSRPGETVHVFSDGAWHHERPSGGAQGDYEQLGAHLNRLDRARKSLVGFVPDRDHDE